jgi:hypothetical protein
LPNSNSQGILAAQLKPNISLVSVSYYGLLTLVAAAPLLLFFDNLIVVGAIQLCAAIGMTIVAIGIRHGQARHLFKLIRVPAALGAIPLIWMLIQLLPIPIGGLSRSIWESAAGALDTPLSASISIDPGLTLIALCCYASMIGMAFVAAAVSIERQHAEKLLLVLCSAAAVISLILMASQVGGFALLDESSAGGEHAAIITAGIIGIILFAASTIMIIERYEIDHQHHKFSSQLLIPITIRITGLLVCSLTLIASDTNYAIFAATCGLATVVIIYFLRRLGFGPTAGLAMGFLAIVAVAAIIWTKGPPVAGDISLRYMTGANADVASLDTRIVGEVGLGGSGAGTFRAISILYGMQDSSDVLRPPTFAAQIAIELGHPALWIIVGLACALIIICARGAFNRGRDFFYPLAGAGVSVAIILNSFSNAGLTNPAISLLVAVTLGLGLAQSISRTL